MQTLATTRDQYTAQLLAFAWDEWAQMGMLASPHRSSSWAQDPEALIVFSLEVGRSDPRLFDELLDWLVMNQGLISTRRLRAMSTVDGDEAIVDAALAWVGRHTSKRQTIVAGYQGEPTLLFRGVGAFVPHPDESFAAHGFLRPAVSPSGKSGVPDLGLPINLAFRMRQILGVGARAEVARTLLTIDAPGADLSLLTRAAGFARRNVTEAVAGLNLAGVLSIMSAGREQRVRVDRERWRAFLGEGPAWRVTHQDWPQLFAALRRILRWLWREDLEDLSEYVRASQARDLLERVHDDFALAGVPVVYGRTVADSILALEATIERGLEALAGRPPDPPSPPGGSLVVYRTPDGRHMWGLRSANGHDVARSFVDFDSAEQTLAAARGVLDDAEQLDFEVVVTNDGTYWWQARGRDDAVASRSPDTFTTRSNAARAARRAQELMSRTRSIDIVTT
jgi:hypothetical protein